MSTNPMALENSLDRGQAVLNCYIKLLSVIPNAKQTMVWAEENALAKYLNDWKGSWSLFDDKTTEIVPFENLFVQHRKYYAEKGLDLKNVPYMILMKDKMVRPQVITDAEAKNLSQSNPALPNTNPINPDMDMATKLTLVGVGGLAGLLILMLIGKRK